MKKYLLAIALFSLFGFNACSGEIEGVVSIKGSMPHTYVALTTSDGTVFSIVGKNKEKIAKEYQYVIIKVKGRVVKQSTSNLMPTEIDVDEIVSVKR